jgi:hypothetical protein
MSDIHQTITIKYPEVPENFGAKLNALLNTLESSSRTLSGHSNNLQGYIGKANSAVQNVSSVSQGKATQALVDTWKLSTVDGNYATGNLSAIASYLRAAHNNLIDDVQTINNHMPVIQALMSTGGTVQESQAAEIQQIVNQFTSSMGNIGFYLSTAAKLINTMNNGTPWACATGFIPGSVYPTFSKNSFDNTYQMASRGSGGGTPITNTAELETALKAKGWNQAKIDALLQNLTADGMSQADLDGFIQTLQNTTLSNDQIINFLTKHPGDVSTIWKNYQLTQNVPNMSTVLRDMATGSPTNYTGSYYQLQWAADWIRAHPNGPAITLVEDTVNGQKAADVILDNGNVIDLKNYNWPDLTAKNLPFRNVATVENEINTQIARYKILYPGQTLTYYFNGAYGSVPEQIQNLLTSEGVKIAYWPPLAGR